jgi:hypothetical protein
MYISFSIPCHKCSLYRVVLYTGTFIYIYIYIYITFFSYRVINVLTLLIGLYLSIKNEKEILTLYDRVPKVAQMILCFASMFGMLLFLGC